MAQVKKSVRKPVPRKEKTLAEYADADGNFGFRIVIRGKCKEGKKEVYKRRVITVHAPSDEQVYEQAEELFKQRNALAGMKDFRYRVIPPWNPKRPPVDLKS